MEHEKEISKHDETQLQIWEYLKKRLVPNTPRKQHCLEIVVLQLGFNYIFVRIYKELSKPPYELYIAVFWNREFDLNEKHVLKVDEMKHECEVDVGMTSLSIEQ